MIMSDVLMLLHLTSPTFFRTAPLGTMVSPEPEPRVMVEDNFAPIPEFNTGNSCIEGIGRVRVARVTILGV